MKQIKLILYKTKTSTHQSVTLTWSHM